MKMTQAGDINEMQMARSVRFEHNGRTYEGVVQWIADNDGILNPNPKHPGCISLMLSDGSVMDDLPKETPVEKS